MSYNRKTKQSGIQTRTETEIKRICKALENTLLRKNADYGDNAQRAPILTPRLSAQDALKVRLSDKIARFIQLEQTGAARVNESLDDTLLDMAGYCVLLLIARKEKS